jgi:hypothetical protein
MTIDDPAELWADYEVPERFSQHERAIAVCTKILAHTVTSFHSDHRLLSSKKRRKKAKAGKVVDDRKDYVLGQAVKVDARRYLQDYLSGDSGRLAKLRWLVRGHFRNQAYGPNRSKRKQIFIEPFWKGPEQGAVNVREHKMGDEP